jgi:hypothetical protein
MLEPSNKVTNIFALCSRPYYQGSAVVSGERYRHFSTACHLQGNCQAKTGPSIDYSYRGSCFNTHTPTHSHDYVNALQFPRGMSAVKTAYLRKRCVHSVPLTCKRVKCIYTIVHRPCRAMNASLDE